MTGEETKTYGEKKQQQVLLDYEVIELHKALDGWTELVEIPNGTKPEATTSEKVRPVKRKTSYKRTRAKKPDGMPRRPLSAYNIFFKEQRERIVEERIQQLRAQETNILARQRIKKPRISFEELAKIIGALWKNIDVENLQRLKNMAAEDAKRYKMEMEVHLHKSDEARWSKNNKEEKGRTFPLHTLSGNKSFFMPPRQSTCSRSFCIEPAASNSGPAVQNTPSDAGASPTTPPQSTDYEIMLDLSTCKETCTQPSAAEDSYNSQFADYNQVLAGDHVSQYFPRCHNERAHHIPNNNNRLVQTQQPFLWKDVVVAATTTSTTSTATTTSEPWPPVGSSFRDIFDSKNEAAAKTTATSLSDASLIALLSKGLEEDNLPDTSDASWMEPIPIRANNAMQN